MKDLRRFANKEIPRRLVPCCSGLIMGDVNAVDCATGAHLSVLQHAQAIPEHERVLHGVAPPRGPRQHALVIDDHIGLAVGERATSASVIAMGEAFERGTAGCNEAGLPHHPGKRVRAATDGVALGAEIVDGRFLGTKRARRMLLSVLSLGIARGGMVTGALMRKVLASWTYSMLYRRPTMCILGSSFKELPSVDRDREVYRLPPKFRDDLALAACFAPMMFTHLQARHSHELICTDASDHYIAAVSAKAPEALCKELWRLRERKGWSAHLVGRATEYVMSCGDERAVADVNEALVELWTAPPKGGHISVPRSLVERFDYLELCCGRGSPMIKAGEAAGL